jgi:hypothetical protein
MLEIPQLCFLLTSSFIVESEILITAAYISILSNQNHQAAQENKLQNTALHGEKIHIPKDSIC